MNAYNAEAWLEHCEADTPDGARSLELQAGIALLPELKKLRQARKTINEQRNLIADLQAKLTKLSVAVAGLAQHRRTGTIVCSDLGDIALDHAIGAAGTAINHPPAGYASWEDWLASGALRDKIADHLMGHSTQMVGQDDSPYPLVDALTHPGEKTIASGKDEVVSIADACLDAIEAALEAAIEGAKP